MSLFNRKKVEVPKIQVDGNQATLYPGADKTGLPLEDPPPEPPRAPKPVELPKTTWAR
jgi:hypothetical protein